MSFFEHQTPLGQPHPWVDPLQQPPLDAPRPDVELALAGHLAPDPTTFPNNDLGRQQYYDAVRAAASQQQHMHHVHGAQAAAAQRAGAERSAELAAAARATFLLLLK